MQIYESATFPASLSNAKKPINPPIKPKKYHNVAAKIQAEFNFFAMKNVIKTKISAISIGTTGLFKKLYKNIKTS